MRALIAISLIVLSGCAATAAPQMATQPDRTRSVYVVGHNGHTGLVVRAEDVPPASWPARRDFPGAEYFELGWGEREYYLREDEGVWLALRALFWSKSSAIHVVGFRGPIAHEFHGAEILELRVSREGLGRLVAFVAASHERDAAGRTIVISPGQRPGNSLFYASHRRFHAFETCNTWIARALSEAGVEVEPGRAFTSTGLMRQLRPLSTAARAPSESPSPSSRR